MANKPICLMVSLLFVATFFPSCSTTHQISNGNTNQCMNVVNHGYPVAGTPLRAKPCDPWQNQQWELVNGQLTGVGGFCVDTQDGASADGTPVLYVPCNGRPSQHWTIANNQIVGIDGKCIDVGSYDQAEFPPLVIATCSSSLSQVWLLH